MYCQLSVLASLQLKHSNYGSKHSGEGYTALPLNEDLESTWYHLLEYENQRVHHRGRTETHMDAGELGHWQPCLSLGPFAQGPTATPPEPEEFWWPKRVSVVKTCLFSAGKEVRATGTAVGAGLCSLSVWTHCGWHYLLYGHVRL